MEEFQNNFVDILTELYFLVGDIEDLDECLNLTYNYLLQHPKKASVILSRQEKINQIVFLHSLLEKDSFLLVSEKLNRVFCVLISLKQYELRDYVNMVLDIYEKVFQCFILEKVTFVLKHGFLDIWKNKNILQNFLMDYSSFICDIYTGKNLIDNPLYHIIYPDLNNFYDFLDYKSFLERDSLQTKAIRLLTSDTFKDLKNFFDSIASLPHKEYFTYNFNQIRNIFLPKIWQIQSKQKMDLPITRKKINTDDEYEYYGSFF